MRIVLRYIGIALAAIGLGILMYIIFIRFTSPRTILSPVSEEEPFEGVQLTPGK